MNTLDKEIIEYYINNVITIRECCKLFKYPETRFNKLLKKEGIKKNRYWSNKGIKFSKEIRYKNMASHIKFNVELKWFYQFEDIDKIILLNYLICRTRIARYLSDQDYKKFIEKFYWEKNFNDIYDTWLQNNKNKYLKPSIDHIIPLSRGGSRSIDNMQILTWSENRAKNDMTIEEFQRMKTYWIL